MQCFSTPIGAGYNFTFLASLSPPRDLLPSPEDVSSSDLVLLFVKVILGTHVVQDATTLTTVAFLRIKVG